MGGCTSVPQKVPAALLVADAGAGHMFKASRLFAPIGLTSPAPACVLVHGFCFEQPFFGMLPLPDWDYMEPLARELSVALNAVILMLGMADDDEAGQEKSALAKLHKAFLGTNAWPATSYSQALSSAIDHLLAVAPAHLGGVQVDPHRIALIGHSMGGCGVLYAASAHCQDRIKAVVALNPSHLSVQAPFDHKEECERYATGADFSGEFGEGTLSHLENIKVPTLIYGSVAEYNRRLNEGEALAPMWPKFECVFSQVGSTVKELYVDNLRDQSCGHAHSALVQKDTLTTFAQGKPWATVCSFLQRHLCGSAAAPLRPENAHIWELRPGNA